MVNDGDLAFVQLATARIKFTSLKRNTSSRENKRSYQRERERQSFGRRTKVKSERTVKIENHQETETTGRGGKKRRKRTSRKGGLPSSKKGFE